MKRDTVSVRLKRLFKDTPNPRFRDPEFEEDYYPCLKGRRVVNVGHEATKFLLENISGRHNKTATFILIEPEGDVRRGEIKMFEDWALVVRIALDEGNYIYNARSKKSCRPVWTRSVALKDRTFDNMLFEQVRLVADPKAYDLYVPRASTRLFAIGDL